MVALLSFLRRIRKRQWRSGRDLEIKAGDSQNRIHEELSGGTRDQEQKRSVRRGLRAAILQTWSPLHIVIDQDHLHLNTTFTSLIFSVELMSHISCLDEVYTIRRAHMMLDVFKRHHLCDESIISLPFSPVAFLCIANCAAPSTMPSILRKHLHPMV